LLYDRAYLFLWPKSLSMQKTIRFIPILMGFLLLLGACGKAPESIRYIPKDAIGVISVNTMELSKKVAWNLLSGSPLITEMTSGSSDTAKLDIEKTGIDPLNTFFAYALPEQRMAGKSKFFLIIPLKDAEKFKTFLKEKFPKAEITTKDKLTIAQLGNNAIIGWDKTTAIAVASPSDNVGNWNDADAMPKPATDNKVLLAEEIQKAFALPKDQSIAENKNFMELQKQAHDISFWLNYEALANGMPQDAIGTAGAILASQKKLIKDTYIAGSLDFEKGKIVGDATYYLNSTSKGIAEAMVPGSINNDLLKRVPGSQMNLILSYHFNPQGLKALIDTMGVLPMANMGLKEFGLTLDEVLNAFTGDFLFTVTDFSIQTKSQSYNVGGSAVNYTSPVPSMRAALTFKIKDKTAFDKLLQIATGQQLLTSSGNNTYSIGPWAHLSTNGDFVALTNDTATASAFMSSAGNADWKIPAEVKNNPYGFYADIKNSIKSLPLDLLYGKEDTAVFHDGKNLMESLVAYGGKVEGNKSTFHFEAVFQNKDENSLLQLINFSKKVAEAEKREADNIDDVIPAADATTTDTAAAPSI
jgi:hypothetical protein